MFTFLIVVVCIYITGNQEPHAWATILWDNAFAEWGRQPFLVPDKVPWHQVLMKINYQKCRTEHNELKSSKKQILAGQ